MLDKPPSTVDNKGGKNAPPFCDKICFLIFNDLFRPTKFSSKFCELQEEEMANTTQIPFKNTKSTSQSGLKFHLIAKKKLEKI